MNVEKGPASAVENLVGHGLAHRQRPGLGVIRLIAAHVRDRNLIRSRRGQDLLSAVLQYHRAQHVVTFYDLPPGRRETFDIELTELKLDVQVTGDLAEFEHAASTDPISLLHIRKRERQITILRRGPQTILVVVWSFARFKTLCQPADGRRLEQGAKAYLDAKLASQSYDKLCRQ